MDYFTALGLVMHSVMFDHRVHVVTHDGRESKAIRELEAAAAAMNLQVEVSHVRGDYSLRPIGNDHALLTVARQKASVRGRTFDRVYFADASHKTLDAGRLVDLHRAILATGGEFVRG